MVSPRRFSFSMRLVPPDFTNRAGEPSLKPPTELGTPSGEDLRKLLVVRHRKGGFVAHNIATAGVVLVAISLSFTYAQRPPTTSVVSYTILLKDVVIPASPTGDTIAFVEVTQW